MCQNSYHSISLSLCKPTSDFETKAPLDPIVLRQQHWLHLHRMPPSELHTAELQFELASSSGTSPAPKCEDRDERHGTLRRASDASRALVDLAVQADWAVQAQRSSSATQELGAQLLSFSRPQVGRVGAFHAWTEPHTMPGSVPGILGLGRLMF